MLLSKPIRIVVATSMLNAIIATTASASARDNKILLKQNGINSAIEVVPHDEVLNSMSKDAQVIDENEKALTKVGELTNKINEALDNIDLDIPIKQGINLLSGLGIRIGYKYEVEPAYIGGYYKRVDGYKVQLRLNPLEWFLDKNTPLLVRLEPGMDMSFTQLFPEGRQARKISNGYFMSRFPFTAEKLLNNLKPGDLAQATVYLNIFTGIRGDFDLAPQVEVRGQVGWIIRAPFDVFIFRADNNKARIRMVARRENGVEGRVSVGIKDDIGVFGVDVVDGEIVNFFEADEIIKLAYSRKNQNAYMADYTIDLSSPEVRSAYDNLFAQALRVKRPKESLILNAANPFQSRNDLRDILISNLAELERIFVEDLTQVNGNTRRVDRNFSGSNGSDAANLVTSHLGIKQIFRVSADLVRRDNQLAIKNMQPNGIEVTDRYYFPTWSRDLDRDALFGLYSERTIRTSNIVYTADENFQPVNFKTIGFYYDYTDRTYKNSEHHDVIDHFTDVLPPEILSPLMRFLEKNNFVNLQGKMKNMRVSARYFIGVEALNVVMRYVSKMTWPEIENLVRQATIEHLITVQNLHINNKINNPFKFNFSCNNKNYNYDQTPRVIKENCKDIEEIALRLMYVLHTGLAPLERHQQMEALTKNSLFQKIGPGIIFKLIPNSQITSSSFFEIKFFSNNTVEPLRFVWPNDNSFPDRELHETINDIQRIMDDKTPDMRLEGDKDTTTERNTKNGYLN